MVNEVRENSAEMCVGGCNRDGRIWVARTGDWYCQTCWRQWKERNGGEMVGEEKIMMQMVLGEDDDAEV